MKTGIYRIRHSKTNRCYIGSSAKSIKRRWKDHCYKLNSNQHENRYLQNVWNKYGADAFVFEVLLYCNPENCLMFEQFALDYYQPEYNICKIAGSSLGVKHTEETKRKMCENHANFSGTNHPQYGKQLSEETKHKISEAQRGSKHYLYGKELNDDWRKKISKGKMGWRPSEETRKRMSKSAIGKTLKESTKKKISMAVKDQWRSGKRKGKKLTLEDINAIRKLLNDGLKQQVIADQFDITRQTVGDIKNGRIWNRIST